MLRDAEHDIRGEQTRSPLRVGDGLQPVEQVDGILDLSLAQRAAASRAAAPNHVARPLRERHSDSMRSPTSRAASGSWGGGEVL